MTDRRSFLARFTGALAGMVASKHVVVEAAPAKKPVAFPAKDFFKIGDDGSGKWVDREPVTYRKKPTRAIRVVFRKDENSRFVTVNDLDVYVDGVRVRDAVWVNIDHDFTVPWADVTVYSHTKIDGIAPDEEILDPLWLSQYVYRGYRA